MYILLLILWFILNGKITLELFFIGIVLCALVYFFACKFLNFSLKKDLWLCRCVPLLIVFIICLVIEVVKSNLNIIHLIWSKEKLNPKIVHFNIPLKNSTLRVLFANAITLTPGTITILLEDEYIVHALKGEYIEDIDKSFLLKILLQMEKKLK